MGGRGALGIPGQLRLLKETLFGGGGVSLQILILEKSTSKSTFSFFLALSIICQFSLKPPPRTWFRFSFVRKEGC